MAEQKLKIPEVKTLVIDKFDGQLTDHYFGDINSGRSWYQIVAGQNPFLKPGQLTWSEAPTLIDPNGVVITDLIMDGKERVEAGVLYIYAIGHTGRLYKIQVNDLTTFNPDYDNPVLITTLTINSPTFTRGGYIDFYGATERIYIGHDMGVTQINFDGTSETFVGSMGSWTQIVPRPLKQFNGSLFVGNGNNIAQIDATLTVVTYTKLSPGFPSSSQTRDMDLSIDGNYLEIVVSRLALYNITSAVQQTVTTANNDSYIFKWNGSDVGSTSLINFPSFSLHSNIVFQDKQYVFGSDQFGLALFNPVEKFAFITECQYISPNAIRSNGNQLTYLTSLYFAGVLQVVYYVWGSFDFEVGNPLGYWAPFSMVANSPETDQISVPWMIPVSNEGIGSSSNSYANNIFGTGKIYFSVLETSVTPTTKYRLYKWKTATSLQIPVSNNLPAGVLINAYQTQTQMFSKKIAIKEVRIYGDPWVANNSFQIDLRGSDTSVNGVIAGGTQVFTAGTNMNVGDDMVSYNPVVAPTYAIGVLLSNLGSVNHTINKIELDYTEAGK